MKNALRVSALVRAYLESRLEFIAKHTQEAS